MAAKNLSMQTPAGIALVGILTIAAGVLTPAQPSAAQAAAPWHSVAEIRDAARGFALQSVDASASASVEIGAIDDRLKLRACSTPLATEAQNEFRDGRGTVVVSCAGEDPWRLFVPVRLISEARVVVARRNVQAGEKLTADDLEQVVRASTTLPYEYLTDLGDAVGLTARRTIAAGTILVPAALARPELVARGALVTLVSGAGGIMVKTEGVALEGGRLNQLVRVESPSGRVVEGVVESANQVRVGGGA
jgi:flagellar basal body P-ring formation protein FlgA